MDFSILDHFAYWFLEQPFMALAPVAVYDYGPICSLVLYRKAPLQVELFVVRPESGFPEEHRHPHVDSYEVHVWGAIHLTLNGKPATPSVMQLSNQKDIYITRVRETDWHGAAPMPAGGAFLSIQEWLHGVVPTSVGLDWEGNPVSPEQALIQMQAKSENRGDQ